MKPIHSIKRTLLLITAVFVMTSCDSRADRHEEAEGENTPEYQESGTSKKINKVNFFIENSESMFGYVRGATEFVDVLTELAQKTDLVRLNTNFDFKFINGRENPVITPIGDSARLLTNILNPRGFNVGNIMYSDLNAMFEIALANSGDKNVSILISDCIYDVGDQPNPLSAMISAGKNLRTLFIHRLEEENLQTLVVQLSSRFRGKFFPGMGGVIPDLDQQRPYYVWIFGDSDLLNKHFSETYLSRLPGYKNMARFFKADDFNIPYEVVSYNDIGSYRQNRTNLNTISAVQPDRNTNEFQFSFAVNLKSIPYPESYKVDITNYICSDNYQIIDINTANVLSPLLFKSLPFVPTHVITVKAIGSPIGTLNVELKYDFPKWIEESTVDNDRQPPVDTNTTFGLSQLIKNVKEAYMEHSPSEILAPFNIIINR